VFTTNTAYNGGAIVNENSNPEITHCQFDSNSAFNGGGAIENETNAQPTFTDCTFTNNDAINSGGAMFSHLNSTTTIVSCSFSSNTSGGYGGALFLIDYCSINISNSTITTNTAIDGGAVYVLDTSFATIDNCTICGNSTPQMVGWNSTEPNCVTDDCANCDDADGDGYPDVFDGCPNDPNKTEPGVCGCGVADVDSDGDTILDCNDAFPSDPSEWVDSDGDGVGDNEDNTFGGCCVTNGCIPTNDPDCTALGGSWLGEDENCENCTSSCVGDINADGTVGVDDLLSMIAAWGACP
jgi:predicted outer membrane repeat protein